MVDLIAKLARESGLVITGADGYENRLVTDYGDSEETIAVFAAMVAEECARVVEHLALDSLSPHEFALEIRRKFPPPTSSPAERGHGHEW